MAVRHIPRINFPEKGLCGEFVNARRSGRWCRRCLDVKRRDYAGLGLDGLDLETRKRLYREATGRE